MPLTQLNLTDKVDARLIDFMRAKKIRDKRRAIAYILADYFNLDKPSILDDGGKKKLIDDDIEIIPVE